MFEGYVEHDEVILSVHCLGDSHEDISRMHVLVRVNEHEVFSVRGGFSVPRTFRGVIIRDADSILFSVKDHAVYE